MAIKYNGGAASDVVFVRGDGTKVGVDRVVKDGLVIWRRGGKDPVGYRYPVYNVGSDPGSGISCWLDGSVTDYSLVRDGDGSVMWKDGWFVVSGDVSIGAHAVCSGDARLILADGCRLRVGGASSSAGSWGAGVEVTGAGNSLAVYGQAAGTGVLSARGCDSAAGIGGGSLESGSNITINGGIVKAFGGIFAAAIGGGNGGAGSGITVNGGEVSATGGDGGAGVGGGNGGAGSGITVNGGIVKAFGGMSGAGVGGGQYGRANGITVNGGEVSAAGYGDGIAGIGGGYSGSSSGVYVAAALAVKADGNNPPATAIAHATGEDIAGKLAGKRYATVRPPAARFVAAGYNSSCSLDADGTSWAALGGLQYMMRGAAYGNGRFVAVGYGGEAFVLDADGTAWTRAAVGNEGCDLYCVAYGNGRFVAAGADGAAYQLADGRTSWTAVGGATVNVYGAAYWDGSFVAVGYNGATYFLADGSSEWTSITDTGSDLRSVAYGGGRFVAVGLGGKAYRLAPGERVWTATTVPAAAGNLYGVAYGNNEFVAVGADGKAYFLQEGSSTWQAMGAAGSSDLRGVAFGNGRFVAVGYGGASYASGGATSTTTWTPLSGASGDLYAVAYRGA